MNRTALTMILTAALVPLGCAVDAELPQPAPRESHPVRIVVFQDKSLSGSSNRTPQLISDDFEPLIKLVLQTGGELAYGAVGVDSNRSLLRLTITSPPKPPSEPPAGVNTFDFAELADEYDRDRASYEGAVTDWEQECERRIGEFLSDLESQLSVPVKERYTDVWGAIHRGDLFLSEPDNMWPATPHKYLILVSDAEDTRSKEPVNLRANAPLLLVNGAPVPGDLVELRPVRFESISAAVHYTIRQETSQ